MASRRVSVLAAFGCLALAGCSAALNGPGPLSAGDTSGQECGPVARGQVLSDGFEALQNSGTKPAIITAVSLANPHDLKLVTAWVIPITGTDLYGVRAGYPPAAGLDPGVEWSRRELAAGASIPRLVGQQVVNLLLVLKPAASTGTASGVRISYRAGGRDYQFQTKIKLVVLVGGDCPID
jgi:hypothetical protein